MTRKCLVLTLCLLPFCQAYGQDVEPRRWTPVPLGVSVFGAGYANTTGDILFEPVLQLEDVEFDAHTLGVSYVRAFSLAGKSARFDALLPWQSVEWTGLLQGEPAAAKRPPGPLCGPTILYECTFRDGSTELVGLTICELPKFEKKNKATCEPF